MDEFGGASWMGVSASGNIEAGVGPEPLQVFRSRCPKVAGTALGLGLGAVWTVPAPFLHLVGRRAHEGRDCAGSSRPEAASLGTDPMEGCLRVRGGDTGTTEQLLALGLGLLGGGGGVASAGADLPNQGSGDMHTHARTRTQA